MKFCKIFTFIVSYIDGEGRGKVAKVKTRDRNEDESLLLQAAMDTYGDVFAQEYRVVLFGEETKFSLFDRL